MSAAVKVCVLLVVGLVVCCGLAVLLSAALDWGNDDEE